MLINRISVVVIAFHAEMRLHSSFKSGVFYWLLHIHSALYATVVIFAYSQQYPHN